MVVCTSDEATRGLGLTRGELALKAERGEVLKAVRGEVANEPPAGGREGRSVLGAPTTERGE